MKLSSGHRVLIAQFVIAGALCGAAYHFLVEPAGKSLANTRAKVSALLSESGQDPGTAKITPEQIELIRRESEARASQIQRRSAPARNEALMFAGVSALAAKRNVRIDQVQPSTKAASRQAPPPPPPAQGPDGQPIAPPKLAGDTRVAYSIVAQGSYTDLAGFIADLSHNLGFTYITGLRLSLVGDETPDQLRADIITEHFAFDAGGAPADGSRASVAAPPPAEVKP